MREEEQQRRNGRSACGVEVLDSGWPKRMGRMGAGLGCMYAMMCRGCNTEQVEAEADSKMNG